MMYPIHVRTPVSARSNVGIFILISVILCKKPLKMLSSSLIVITVFLFPCIYGSAIPMWEYLSRGEKMSHLFNLFVQQVEKHCSTRPEPDCSKLLLVYGLTNLAKMEDESLDGMDPYQRGANEIVWDSMMKGSSKHSHVHSYTTTKSPSTTLNPTTSKPLDDGKIKEEDDMIASDPGSLEAASNVNVEEAEPQSFLLGPMVVRVLPNGMPIPGEKSHLPKDEDIEEFSPSRFRPQTATNRISQDNGDSNYYNSNRNYQDRYNRPSYQNPYNTVRVRSPIYPTIP